MLAFRTTRARRFPRRERCFRQLAAIIAATSVSLPFHATASDPKAIIQAAGLDELLVGSEPEGQPATSKAPARKPAEFAGQEGVVALFDGRVVAGKVLVTPGGYLLKRPGATDEMIPTFLVQTAADSLTGCYENLKESINQARPDDHLELANWCVRQRLLEEAKSEVLAVLKLDPNRREARDLLVKLEEATNPRPRNQESEAAPARTRDGFLDSTGRTTEGLSPELTSLFVRRIQPLLMSKCGNAACHGGDASDQFRLANVRRSSASGRTTTLENMRQVLSLVDAGEPDSTRLMGALSSPAHIGVFSGPAGQAQEASIRAWVEGAAGSKGLKTEAVQLAGGTPVWTPETIALISGKKLPGQEKSSLDPGIEASPVSRPGGLQKATSPPRLQKVEGGLAEKILHEERPDPFDPDEFNRLVQGRFGVGPAVGPSGP